MHHVPGRCAPFGRCPWTDVVVHAPRPRCRTSGKGVRFQRSGCRTANGQGVVFGRHIHLWPENWGEYLRQVNFIEKFACFCSLAKVNATAKFKNFDSLLQIWGNSLFNGVECVKINSIRQEIGKKAKNSQRSDCRLLFCKGKSHP